jgi:hypothetical protein
VPTSGRWLFTSGSVGSGVAVGVGVSVTVGSGGEVTINVGVGVDIGVTVGMGVCVSAGSDAGVTVDVSADVAAGFVVGSTIECGVGLMADSGMSVGMGDTLFIGSAMVSTTNLCFGDMFTTGVGTHVGKGVGAIVCIVGSRADSDGSVRLGNCMFCGLIANANPPAKIIINIKIKIISNARIIVSYAFRGLNRFSNDK